MDPLETQDPTWIGEISIRGRLGSGGFGQVYFGVTADGDPVAVKVLHDYRLKEAATRARFDRELQAFQTVQSPHVAAFVAGSGVEDEKPWIAIEYVRGLSLKDFVNTRGVLSPETAATLGVLVATALADIHANGLIHRDLTAANILLGREGPKVIDLGLAAFTDGPTDLTTSDALIGTVSYLSPEQAGSGGHVSTATDVYSLGTTLLFALTKHFPYRGRRNAMLQNIARPDVPPDLVGLPGQFYAVVHGMLAHEPHDRPTPDEVCKWLEPIITGPLYAGIRAFTEATYIERADDPPEPTPQPRPRPKDLSAVAPPGSVIQQLADRLRSSYSANARF